MSQGLLQKTNIYSFDANHIEAMLAQNDWNGCWEYLGGVIETLTITSGAEAQAVSMKLQRDMADDARKQYVNDFGALLGELFMYLLTDPNTTLSDASYENLIYFHETLHTLFYIYDIHNTDEAVKTILGDGKKTLSPSQQKKLLLLLSLDSELDVVKILHRADMKYRLPALVGYMSHRKIFRQKIYANKIKLYEVRKDLERSPGFLKAMSNLVTIYFLSSYLNTPDKHILKENINAAMKSFLNSRNKDFKHATKSQPEKSKYKLDANRPTILVHPDYFSKNHAMFRCYGDRTIALQKEFNIVIAMQAVLNDPRLADDFENIASFSNLTELYKIIHDVKPDIIFLPSVGMSFYSLAMSTIRLAPIQIMSLGHPATTMSENIDYVLGPTDMYDQRAFPKDKYIGDGPARTFIPLLSKEQFFAPVESPPRPDNTIRVAVVGTDIKVSYPFFKLLKEIVEESPFKIHVSFMMGVNGIDSLYLEKYLKENFENSTYHGWQTYDQYINTIKNIDIVVNPFPFGHTNTIIDTLMCGKPCIGMDGVEPASKTEGHVLNAVGLKEQFVAKDEEDYKKKFFAIADRILKGETEFYDREAAYEAIFKHTAEDVDYSKVMKWLYDNHSRLKASDKKYFEMFEEV